MLDGKMVCAALAAIVMAAGSIGCTELTNTSEITIAKDPPKPPPAPVAPQAPAAAQRPGAAAAAAAIRQAGGRRAPGTG